MSVKNSATLNTQADTDLASGGSATITAAKVRGMVKDITDSCYNRLDDTIPPPPVVKTKLQVATAIAGSALIPGQAITISDRTDENPLTIVAVAVNKIAPTAIWLRAGTPLFVIVDYAAGYEGETSPFRQVLDQNGRLGIGVNQPTKPLHVVGEGNITSHLAVGGNETVAGTLAVTGNATFSTAAEVTGTLKVGGGDAVSKIIKASAALDFASTNAGESSDLTIALAGAALGNVVMLGVPNASVEANTCYTAWVSAADTVTVRFNNYSSGAVDPASGTFTVAIIKF